jgi:hypothetical protein
MQYDNILAFNIGNEVINLVSNTNAARQSPQHSAVMYCALICYSLRQGRRS